MKSIEFKSRQLWLEFECAVSDALRVVADSIENLKKWFKDWKPKKVKNRPAILTLPLFQHQPPCHDFQS